MKTKIKYVYTFMLVFVLLLAVDGCASAPMAVPPTATPIPPTPTAVLPTSPSSPTTKPTLAPNVSAILTAVAPQGQSSAPRVLPQATIHVGNLDRTYLYYVPANLPRNAPLLFAFHGSGQNGEAMRDFTGFGFESLADQYGFIVVYPNGYQNSWNACRKYSTSPAKAVKFHLSILVCRAMICPQTHADGTNPALESEKPDCPSIIKLNRHGGMRGQL